jgi:hypothetical protein
VQLHQQIQALSCEKEQACNLLQYAAKKHEGILSSIKHAQSAIKGLQNNHQQINQSNLQISEFKTFQSCVYGQT